MSHELNIIVSVIIIEINAFDIETYLDENGVVEPYCLSYNIGMCVNSIYKKYDYENIVYAAIENIFENTDENICFYIHNIDYDGRILIKKIMNKSGINIETILKNNSLYCVKVLYMNKIIEFRCSYKLIPLSLKRIALDFNIGEKLPYPYDCINEYSYRFSYNVEYYVKYINNESKDLFIKLFVECEYDIVKYTIRYCENDVYLTYNAIKVFIKIVSSLNFDLLKYNIYSISSLSVNIFKKLYNKKNIKLNYDSKIDSLIRRSYFGGRCEIFANTSFINSESGVLHYDFSGMYSQCMCEKFCYGEYDIIYENIDLKTPGYYDIEYTSDMYMPILPHRDINTGKLLFVNGVNRGLFWFEEILLFIKNGGVVNKINYGVVYSNYDYIMDEFVHDLKKIREMGGSYKVISKMIVNSLYGRLAMNISDHKSMFIRSDEYFKYLDKYNVKSASFYDDICILCYYDKKKKNPSLSNIAIASAIASKARVKLYEGFKSVIDSGGRILYCDTDSIFAEYENVNMHINKKYGEVFWDGGDYKTLIKKCFFISPKEYAVVYSNDMENIKIKGIFGKNIKYNELLTLYKNRLNLTTNVSIINKGGRLVSKILEKTINLSKYDKRVWLDDYKTESRALSFDYKTGIYK